VSDAAAFLRANTAPACAPLVPEIALHLATEITPIWQATEDWLHRTGLAPPFWAFAWPGAQVLARHVLDHPATVAGAALVEAAEIDPMATTAIALNAAANGVSVTPLLGDLTGTPCRWDLILCGDVCYEAPMTAHILPWLRSLTAGAEVWVADPGRAYLPRDGLEPFARMTVPTTTELEDRREREVTLYRLLAGN